MSILSWDPPDRRHLSACEKIGGEAGGQTDAFRVAAVMDAL